MAPQQYIHLFRHEVAEHNVSCDFYMHDPLLTPCGIESAKETLEREYCFKKPTLVLISPLQRCIQTALYAFHPEWNKKAAEFFWASPPQFVAMPQLQELGVVPCNNCHPLEFLKEKYGKELKFPDEWFSTDDWLIKRGTEYEDNDYLFAKRAEFVRQYIKGLEDREVVVVTHGGFAHYLANQWEEFGSRSNFEDLDNGEVASMVVHKLSDSETQLGEEVPSWAAPVL